LNAHSGIYDEGNIGGGGPMKGIFFDLGWVLFYPASGDWLLTRKCYEYIDTSVWQTIPKERTEAAYAAALQYLDDNHLILNVADEHTQFRSMYQIFADALPELHLSADALDAISHDKVFNDDNFIFYDDVKQALEALKPYKRLGIISDTWPSSERMLKYAGL
jgi:putative hydrolase of the HAD superfamily